MTKEEDNALAAVAKEAIVELRRRRRWQIFFRLIMVFLFIGYLTVLSGHRSNKKDIDTQAHIAVVEVEGLIAASESANAHDLNEALGNAFENEKVSAVFVAINSGGGSPVQSGRIFREINRLKKEHKKPVYAIIDEMGASGAYYIAAAADEIVVDPSSIVGSIGVISHRMGFEELIDKLGIEQRVFTSGEHKDFLNQYKPLQEFEVAHMQQQLRAIHQQFIDAVKEGRGDKLVDSEENKLFSGLFWTGDKAIELGLADRYGDIDSLARELFPEQRLVFYSPSLDPFERLKRSFSMRASAAVRGWLQTTLRLENEGNPVSIK